jgi:hypothetical protein
MPLVRPQCIALQDGVSIKGAMSPMFGQFQPSQILPKTEKE